MKIFISSTYEDLKEERKEAIRYIDRIGHSIAMEKFFASNHQSKDVCLEKLQECDAVILILGFKYGSMDKMEGISFTEIEYNTAKTIGLPVLYLPNNKQPHCRIRPYHQRRLESFRKREQVRRHRRPEFEDARRTSL